MGYTTEFTGRLNFKRKLTNEQARYLIAFSGSRRMKRNPKLLKDDFDPVRDDVDLPIGDEGGYCVSEHEDSVVDYNTPPVNQPGLWCQWVPTNDMMGLEWDGGEKFYEYTNWANYINDHFLSKWNNGYAEDSSVIYQGEYIKDRGKLVVLPSGRVVQQKM